MFLCLVLLCLCVLCVVVRWYACFVLAVRLLFSLLMRMVALSLLGPIATFHSCRDTSVLPELLRGGAHVRFTVTASEMAGLMVSALGLHGYCVAGYFDSLVLGFRASYSHFVRLSDVHHVLDTSTIKMICLPPPTSLHLVSCMP